MKKNEYGTTLVETIIAIGILGIVTTGLIATISYMYGQRAQLVTTHSRTLAVANQINDIRVQAGHYIKNYAPVTLSTDDILDSDSLPIGISPTYIGPFAGCERCTGKIGFVIRPVQGFDGIFIATIRSVQISNSEQTGSADYELLVVPK